MFHYTTCRDCGNLLHTTGNTVHPGCTPKPTRAEQLAAQWSAAAATGDTATETLLAAQIDRLANRPPRLAAAALTYAGWGWPVFPLKPRTKMPATRHGFKDATTNPDRIAAWWCRHPDANIGLPTGHLFDVIDIDAPVGCVTYADLVAQQDPRTGVGALPDSHARAATASGGLHLYTEPSGGGNLAGILPGIDYRGAGGYVVAPPSTLGAPGRAWSWIDTPSPTLRTHR